MLSFTAKNDMTLSTNGLDFGCPRGVPKASLRIPDCNENNELQGRYRGEITLKKKYERKVKHRMKEMQNGLSKSMKKCFVSRGPIYYSFKSHQVDKYLFMQEYPRRLLYIKCWRDR